MIAYSKSLIYIYVLSFHATLVIINFVYGRGYHFIEGFGTISTTTRKKSAATIRDSSETSTSKSMSAAIESSSASCSSSSSSPLKVTDNGVYIVDKMPERLPNNLKNKYFLLRHGQSEGNVEGVISSSRSLAKSSKHGLTSLGVEQGEKSAAKLLQLIEDQQQISPSNNNGKKKKLYFYSSPFSRARQTAEACLSGLFSEEKGNSNNNLEKIRKLNLDVQKKILIDYNLMERYFGDLDGEPLSTYGYVWPNDMNDPTQTGYNVESVAAVATRLKETIFQIEEEATRNSSSSSNESHTTTTTNANNDDDVGGEEGDIIVLTSHADVLQILQTYASGLENVGEFSSYRFGNGEVRFMGRTTDTLPEPQPLEIP